MYWSAEGQRGEENWPSPLKLEAKPRWAWDPHSWLHALLTSAVLGISPEQHWKRFSMNSLEDAHPQPPCPNSLPEALSTSGPLNSLNLWPHQPYPPQGQA